jgi:acetylglutamate kinase
VKTLKVVKIGGNIIDNEQELHNFIKQFSKLNTPKILVHGGGNEATKLANSIGVEVKITNGRRITDEATLGITTMVYAGKINKHIVANLQYNNCNSVGFSGADGNTIVSEKRQVKEVDFGFVGDIVEVNPEVIKLMVNNNITPVFCALTHNKKGQLLNTNADTIASELAISLTKDFNVELYYCFEKKGVLQNAHDDNSLIETINSLTYQELIHKGVITDGMLPKLNNCFHAINNEVGKVCVGKTEMLFEKESKFTNIKK